MSAQRLARIRMKELWFLLLHLQEHGAGVCTMAMVLVLCNEITFRVVEFCHEDEVMCGLFLFFGHW